MSYNNIIEKGDTMFEMNRKRLLQGSHKWLMQAEAKSKMAKLPPLTVADTDFFLPKFLKNALIKSIEELSFGYGTITDSYLDSIIKWYHDRFSFAIEKSWITPTTGVISAIANSLLTFSEKGDGIMIQSPVYHVFYRVIENLERQVVVNNLVLNPDHSYSIDFGLLEKQIVSNKVKMFILCSPHNPVGKVFTLMELKKMSEIFERHQVIVIADEIHHDLIMPPHHHTIYSSINTQALNHSILCTSTGKSFSIPGLENANIVIANQKLKDAFVLTASRSEMGILHPNTMGVYASMAAYREGSDYVDAFIQLIFQNACLVENFVKEHCPMISLSPLQGSYLMWLDFRKLELDHVTLLEDYGIFLSDGNTFGENGQGFMRMNLATSPEIIKEILERIQLMIEKEYYEKNRTE